MIEHPTVTDTRHEEVVRQREITPAGQVVEPATGASVTHTAMVSAPPGYRGVQLVWLMGGIVATILSLHIVLVALAANPTAGFVRFIQDISSPLVAPFRGIVADQPVGPGFLDVNAILAMVVYLAATAGVVQLVRILTAPRPPRVR